MKPSQLARIASGALLCSAVGALPLYGQQDPEEEPIEIERTIRLEAELTAVERLPMVGTQAIARFRIVAGEYRGALLSLAYDYALPVRMLSWHVHDASGYQRIGGAEIPADAADKWRGLLYPGSDQPYESLILTLVQHDLNEDEEHRRWHFKDIEEITPRPRFGELLAPGQDPRVRQR